MLIPKKKNPSVIGDLRPISLCNVLVKVITKVLANRMKNLLEGVVSESQSAFIPGRLISDNIMVSFELMHYLKRKRRGKEGSMALKLDMSKAYDRIECGYLRAILGKMGFHAKWIQLVMQSVQTVTYGIKHGAKEMRTIYPTRGIRQGDPLSPYLFILCAEGLSALLHRYEDNQLIKGIKICCQAPNINHMLFADDSYIYCGANIGEAVSVKNLLYNFELASSQKVNLEKSSICFSSNINSQDRGDICQILNMTETDENTSYLGLPSMVGRNRSVTFGFIKDKVRKRLQSWDGRFFSQGGRETLVKAVAQTLPSYAMSVFLLPIEITKDIERTISKFWWGKKSDESRGISWMGWEKMSNHKSKGGLGFRIFRDFNISLLGKQG